MKATRTDNFEVVYILVWTELVGFCRRISILLFDHMMHLDLQFHLMRKTGEISKICDRGTDAMQAMIFHFRSC